jgi:hypothetical protein
MNPSNRWLRAGAGIAIALAARGAALGCGGGGSGINQGGTDAGTGDDASTNDSGGFFVESGTGDASCITPCGAGFVCYEGTCILQQPACNTDDQCQNDSYCNTTLHECIPYGTDGRTSSPSCVSVVPVGIFAPAILCEFTSAPAGDSKPGFLNVIATPTVATFDPGGKPSIVVPFYDGTDGSSEQDGILRVLDGGTCAQTANLFDVGGYVSAPASPAIGDLDGDGIPEIVAYSKPAGTGGASNTPGSMVAFTKKAGKWSVLWRAKQADGVTDWSLPWGNAAWGSPSIHDLDDDGKPEIIHEAAVFDSTGKLIADTPADYVTYSARLMAVIGDLNGDGAVELVNGKTIWSFDKTTKKWVTKVADTGIPAGFTALADFGNGIDGVFDGKAEVVVVSAANVYVHDATGAKVWGPISLGTNPYDGTPITGGGPPTIADFDGDGQPEIAVAASDAYVVLDPDCGASIRPGGKCASASSNGILWKKKSQDHSSNVTGSSVFDFSGAGKASAIYADECFARVYDGTSGEVIFSQYHSSCTWYENPIVADVNLDDRAELIVPSNLNCSDMSTPGAGIPCGAGEVETANRGVDATFAGLRCTTGAECPGGSCDSGFCRCTTDADCCPDKDVAKCQEVGFICAAPMSGTPGTGNTCRASHPHGWAGIRVYHDFADRWVQSRPLWNQHAYSITNVNDDGTIPQTSKWVPNWKATSPKFNDYRKNSPGTNDPSKSPDLTSKGGIANCNMGKLTLSAQVCNRGADIASDNFSITFYAGDSADPSKLICTAKTSSTLAVGACVTLSCDWTSPPTMATDVTAVANADGLSRDCNKDNQMSFLKGVQCGPA